MKKLFALLLGTLLLCLPGVAFAGTLVVQDSTGWVPSGDVAALQGETGTWPFDVHLIVENAPSFQALEDHAHTSVDGPNVMVIAIDPGHHKTVTRFGTGTGVKAGDYDSITQAGGAHFRSHEIRQGLEAMILRAKASKEATTAISASNTPVVVKEGLGTGAWLCIILAGCALVGFIVWLVRKQKRDRERFEKALDDNRLETSELVNRNVREMTYEDTLEKAAKRPVKSYQTASPRVVDDEPVVRRRSPAVAAPSPVVISQPSPVVVNNSGSDLATGILIGEMMNQPRTVEREVVVERVREPARSYTPPPTSSTSDDSGGSSSFWDSGSSSTSSDSSSSSYDSGGSSSSFDIGGSSDFGGGGGFDGGGGSGDW